MRSFIPHAPKEFNNSALLRDIFKRSAGQFTARIASYSYSYSSFSFISLFLCCSFRSSQQGMKEPLEVKLKRRIKRGSTDNLQNAERDDTFMTRRKIVTTARSLTIKLASLWRRSSEWHCSPPLVSQVILNIRAFSWIPFVAPTYVWYFPRVKNSSRRHSSAMILGRIFLRIITSPRSMLKADNGAGKSRVITTRKPVRYNLADRILDRWMKR